MIRVKDAEKSLKFYQDVMGMTLFREGGNPSAGFTLYFLGYPGKQGVPQGSTADREGLLELTWNHGTEKDESFKYHSGNDEPQGFGHICEFLINTMKGISVSMRLTWDRCFCRQHRRCL